MNVNKITQGFPCVIFVPANLGMTRINQNELNFSYLFCGEVGQSDACDKGNYPAGDREKVGRDGCGAPENQINQEQKNRKIHYCKNGISMTRFFTISKDICL